MTRPEFMGQFDRLCKGFRYDSTQEQSEAWFRKIGHVDVQDWAEAVNTLLCSPRFPLLDPVLAAIDEAGNHRRRMSVEREKRSAVGLARLAQEGGRGCPLSPELFAAIKAHAGREQVRHYIALVEQDEKLEPLEKRDELHRLKAEAHRLTAILCEMLPKLHEEELAEFMARYGEAVAA